MRLARLLYYALAVVSQWTYRQSIPNYDFGDNGDYFGAAVALSSDGAFLYVGAPNRGSDNAGEVFTYSRTGDGNTWQQDGFPTLPKPATADRGYGRSIVLVNNDAYMFVSATQAAGSGVGPGSLTLLWKSVYTYYAGPTVTASTALAGDQFALGLSASADGLTLAASSGRGLYLVTPAQGQSEWTATGVPTVSGPLPTGITGSIATHTAAISGDSNTVALGAASDEQVLVYSRASTTDPWIQGTGVSNRCLSSRFNALFGTSVALDLAGLTLVVY